MKAPRNSAALKLLAAEVEKWEILRRQGRLNPLDSAIGRAFSRVRR